MSTNRFCVLGMATGWLFAAAGLCAAVAGEVTPAAPGATEPLKRQLPKHTLKGTPPDLPSGPNLEPFSEKPPADFLVPKGVTNLAAGKPVTSSVKPFSGELSQITDEKKEAFDYDSVEMKKGTQWVQVDLGESCVIHAVAMWHDHRSIQVMQDVVVQVADDPEFKTGVTTLFNNDTDNSSGLGVGADREYFELEFGRVVDGKGTKARYVRGYTKGSNSSTLNCWQELEVYGFASPAPPAGGRTAGPAVEFKAEEAAGRIQVLIGGRETFAYVFGTNVDLPHFYPVRSPSGKSMTVQQTEPYPHHRSFWFADTVQLGTNRQASFYNALYSGTGDKKNPQPPYRDHIRHAAFTTTTYPAGQSKGELALKLVWEMDDGKIPVLDEARRVRVVALGDGEYFLDLAFTLTASYGDVTFRSDAVHYAWPFIRLNQDFNSAGGGVLVNSEGGTGQTNTNMKVARWVDFSRAGAKDAEGLAMFSHPANEHPHAWLTRDYGCIGPRRIEAKCGNPFTLKRGERLHTRAGVLVHKGDVQSGRVAERYEAYAAGKL